MPPFQVARLANLASLFIALVAAVTHEDGAQAPHAATPDWPQWRGTQRDGRISGFRAPSIWPETLACRWSATVGLGDATPALVGDKLYVFARQGDREATLCLDALHGRELWREEYEAEAVTGPGRSHPGPRSSPAVAQGKVVTLGVGGVLSCLDAGTGRLLWRKDPFPKTVPISFVAMSPLLLNGTCIAHLGAHRNSAVIAYDLASGEEKWRWAGDGPAYASPVPLTAAGVRQVVVQADLSLVGLAVADGRLLWKVPTPIWGAFSNSVTPVVDGEVVIYSGQGAGTHAVKIERRGDGFAAARCWTNKNLDLKFSTPVLKDRRLFGLTDRGTFFCLDVASGSTVWVDEERRGEYGAILDAGPTILALTEKGVLFAFDPDGTSYAERARIRVSEKETYAHPVVAGRRIYVRDRERLSLLEFP